MNEFQRILFLLRWQCKMHYCVLPVWARPLRQPVRRGHALLEMNSRPLFLYSRSLAKAIHWPSGDQAGSVF